MFSHGSTEVGLLQQKLGRSLPGLGPASGRFRRYILSSPCTGARLMNTTRHRIEVLGLLVASLACGPCAAAAAWPEKPVRLLVPWAPGGSTDIVARLISPDLTKRLKQSVVVDTRPAAGSILGMHLAAASPPDGYTFMVTSTAYGHLLDKKQAKGIDYAKSYEPVALIGLGDSVLAVHPSLPVNSVKELIALAKKRPGELNYSSSGIGGFPQMNTEFFEFMTGTDIVHGAFLVGGSPVLRSIAGYHLVSV